MQVFWHRRDLRPADNVGLADAATLASDSTRSGESSSRVLPVFVFDDQILDHASPPRVSFMLDALHALRDWYRSNECDLLIRFGDPSAVIPDVTTEFDVTRVVWNHDYSGLAEERDDAVRTALEADDVQYAEFHDAVLHEPGAIRTNEGAPYSVYSYFWKKWQDREPDDPVAPPHSSALHEFSGDEPLPTIDDLGFEEPVISLPRAGTDAARERLHAFLSDDVYRYEDARERPALDATSRLSQDLKFGTIGIREVHTALVDALESAPGEDERASVREFVSQLAWREFYTQVLYFNQHVVAANYKTYANPIEWRNDPDELAAWKAGETGYPIVDAGMRQLREEAFVHNRVRMIVASFLTKDLLWDWRAGYDHFREHLVDHDTANDTGGWQWAASTGTDAQPYFRIFNPQTQGERYDPDAEYIKRYLPELVDVHPETIHGWPDLDDEARSATAPGYPDPIVDHGTRRETAIEIFETARDD